MYRAALKGNKELEKELNVPIVAIDYHDVQSAAATLDKHRVHTVVSALNLVLPPGPNPEADLIRAADASSSTKRMITSCWGMPVTEK